MTLSHDVSTINIVLVIIIFLIIIITRLVKSCFLKSYLQVYNLFEIIFTVNVYRWFRYLGCFCRHLSPLVLRHQYESYLSIVGHSQTPPRQCQVV